MTGFFLQQFVIGTGAAKLLGKVNDVSGFTKKIGKFRKGITATDKVGDVAKTSKKVATTAKTVEKGKKLATSKAISKASKAAKQSDNRAIAAGKVMQQTGRQGIKRAEDISRQIDEVEDFIVIMAKLDPKDMNKLNKLYNNFGSVRKVERGIETSEDVIKQAHKLIGPAKNGMKQQAWFLKRSKNAAYFSWKGTEDLMHVIAKSKYAGRPFKQIDLAKAFKKSSMNGHGFDGLYKTTDKFGNLKYVIGEAKYGKKMGDVGKRFHSKIDRLIDRFGKKHKQFTDPWNKDVIKRMKKDLKKVNDIELRNEIQDFINWVENGNSPSKLVVGVRDGVSPMMMTDDLMLELGMMAEYGDELVVVNGIT